MRICFDTEFIEDGKTIDLISIGMVAQDGRSYYAENLSCDRSKASDWVRENVLPHLDGSNIRQREHIASDIIEFVGDETPEFWAYYADYDWVVMCQLFGTMMQLPKGWPMYCRDFKQWLDENGNPRMSKHLGVEHNALDDALWLQRNFDLLKRT